jgi:sRNA-binding carbon storage regulator CsrA
MLLLDVKPGERIAIGKDIYLTIEKKSGQNSRVAIQAPKDVKIDVVPAPSSVVNIARKGLAR